MKDLHPSAVNLLKNFWENTLHQRKVDNQTWNEQVRIIHQQGKGLEETLRYLYNERPPVETFLSWMKVVHLAPDNEYVPADVFTSDDVSFFNTNGYVVLRNAISDQQCCDARQAIFQFLDADPDDSSTWYKAHHEQRGLMLMFYHHPALNVNRLSGRIKKAFEQLYQTSAIHLVVDKVSFNPPETQEYTFMGSPLHWDVSLALPIPFKLQGLVYLNDVDESAGAFHCVPGFHLQLEEWLTHLPTNKNPREEAIHSLQPIPIPGKAGDLLIWHQALPHCAAANHSHQPRLVQYITYDPDDYVSQEVWI